MEAISIVIPLRVDSPERKENLHCALQQLLQMDFVYIDILEADREQYFSFLPHERIRYRFIYDKESVFYRTRYLNLLLREARHPIVGIWDTDVLVPEKQLIESIGLINKGCIMCFPYDGDFRFLSSEESKEIRVDLQKLHEGQGRRLIGRPSVGGAFLVNKAEYMKAGGENEGFYGWGPEDVERVKRMEILELPIGRVSGPLYHLYHDRLQDNGVNSNIRAMHNRKVLLQTCRMNKQELKEAIELQNKNSI